MQPAIVRGGGERGNLSWTWTRDQHPIKGGGVSINNSNNVYSSCVQEFFIRLL